MIIRSGTSFILLFLLLSQLVLASSNIKSVKLDFKRKLEDFFDDDDNKIYKPSPKSKPSQKTKETFFYLSRFEEILHDCDFDFRDFQKHFNDTSREKPEFLNHLIMIVVNFENLEWILWLYQNGYNVEFISEEQKQNILLRALKSKNIPLLEFILEDVDDPFEFVNGKYLNSEMVNILSSIKSPVLSDNFKDFRRKFYYNFGRKDQIMIRTTREAAFTNTYKTLMSESYSFSWFNGLLRPFIIFEGEAGFDNGGLTIKWIELLIESFLTEDPSRIFNPKYESSICSSQVNYQESDEVLVNLCEAFFIANSKGIYLPNTNYSPNEFQFIGTIFAFAFCFDVPIGIEFLPALYRILVDEKEQFDSREELKIVDEEVYNSLIKIEQENIEQLDDLQLEIDGILLTRNNFESSFIMKSKYLTFGKYKDHLEAFKRGFFSIVDLSDWRRLRLKSSDLVNIFKGKVEITSEEFVNNVNVDKMIDEFTKLWLFEIITEITPEERLLLFKFITAKSAVPYRGLRGLLVPISFSTVFIPDGKKYLPTASTCGSIMKIPIYGSKKMLKEKLIYAIKSCETFELE